MGDFTLNRVYSGYNAYSIHFCYIWHVLSICFIVAHTQHPTSNTWPPAISGIIPFWQRRPSEFGGIAHLTLVP